MRRLSYKILSTFIFIIFSLSLKAQDYKINFAILNSRILPDSVQITNLDQNTSLTLPGYKVLRLVKTITSVNNFHSLNPNLKIFPNPFFNSSTIELYNKQKGYVKISIVDVKGRVLVKNSKILPAGNYSYRLSGLGSGIYFVNIQTSSSQLSSLVVSTAANQGTPSIKFLGQAPGTALFLKNTAVKDTNIVQMQYNAGEKIRFTAYLKTRISVKEDVPTSSKTINFDFSTGTDPYMMPYYTGRILPEPKQVEYKNEFLSLANTAIILNNVEQNDPRLKYLLDRITRYGGKYVFATDVNDDYTCIIKVNDDALTPPQHPQGYVIQSSGKTISLKGSDYQGLLWAISSLNQMIFNQNGVAVVRKVNVTDWPDLLLRGMLPEDTWDIKQLAHFMVAFKLNVVDFRASLSIDKEHAVNWRLPRSDVFYQRLDEAKEQLTSLGFLWYAGARFLGYDQVPQINCSSDSDFNTIYQNFAIPIAKAGGNLSVQFDDTRYPLSPDDENNFGSAAKADFYIISRLYDSLKNNYPDIRIAFCPPYYWGPVGPNPLPESRDDYLSYIGNLPDSIDIYWTGPRVRSTYVTQEDVEWEVNNIKRKPLVFQNGVGTGHAYDYDYFTDPLYSLKDWYYDGYLDDIKAYLMNGANIDKSRAMVSVANWAWNYAGFNPEISAQDAAMKLADIISYPVLKAMDTYLSVFDPYEYQLSFDALRNADLLNEALDSLIVLDSELQKINNASPEFWTAAESVLLTRAYNFVGQVNQALQDPIVQEIINRPDASVTMYFAVKDGNFDPNDTSQILIEPNDFSGCEVINYGYTNSAEGINLEDRPTAFVTGQGTSTSEMTATFNLTDTTIDYQLVITGADDYLDEKCPIRIQLNDTVLFDGPNNFSNKTWNTQIFTVPAAKLHSTNTLTITNTSPDGNFDAPPAFLLNYVVVRPKQE